MLKKKIKTLEIRPEKQGLYDPEFEKDSCGVGLVANIKGIPSREIMDDAYIINSRMDHRGGCGFEENTGDGAGILLALPHEFFKEEAQKLKINLPEKGKYAVGNIFFPQKKSEQKFCKKIIENVHEKILTCLQGVPHYYTPLTFCWKSEQSYHGRRCIII